MNRIIRLLVISGAVLLLSTCEYLFYSPAFMPAVVKTSLNANGALNAFNYNEEYNGEIVADSSTSTSSLNASVTFAWDTPTINDSVDISALRAISVSGTNWQGVSEFLGMFFVAGFDITSASGTGGPYTFHGIYSYDFTYSCSTVQSWELPYPAPLGINENSRTYELEGTSGDPLAIVSIHVNSAYEELAGDVTFVFGADPQFGMLYMLYEHDNGTNTVIYQEQINASVTVGDYFALGTYDYVINCFIR